MNKREKKERLRLWQERLKVNENAYAGELDKMTGREALYAGTNELKPLVPGDRKTRASHVRNICAELVEAQVDSNIPQPKVTARRAGDEDKAKLIEDMLRNELDRMPFEQMNDVMERMVPIQGGAAFLTEWDNTERTHYTIGELTACTLHPKQIIPQDGVYTGIEDMDYIILKVPQTKEYIRRRYGKDVTDEGEAEPEIKGFPSPLRGEGKPYNSGGSAGAASDDLVTQYVAYYRNDKGGIGLFSWVNEITLEDLEDYQARRLRRCAKCGAIEPLGTVDELPPTPDGTFPGMIPPETGGGPQGGTGVVPLGYSPLEARPASPASRDAGPSQRSARLRCPYCGGTKWEESTEEFEEVYQPILRSDGTEIPGLHFEALPPEGGGLEMLNPALPPEEGEMVLVPTRIPFYKPDIYPVILQRNVSVYGRFLGDSDIDKIEYQQNTINRIESKIIDKLMKSGSYITLPPDASVPANAEDGKVIRLAGPQDMQMIQVFDMEGKIEQDMAYLAQVYDEARQIIGITDSFQGRRDTTATSGKAKEFAAAQSAGRLESKRVMKNAAYANLFEAMFKFKLAYTDEPRPVVADDIHGNKEYKEFNRYDFLEQDAAGEWHWNDQFLFSCDTSAPLASNREAMWQETRMNLETGAFGDPTQLQTLILFWTKMEMLHYPGAGETKSYLEEELQSQQLLQQRQALAAQQAQRVPPLPQTETGFGLGRKNGGADMETAPQGGGGMEQARSDAAAAPLDSPEISPEVLAAIDARARGDAQAIINSRNR